MADSELRTGVSVLGVPWDEQSSFLRGCAMGPARIRAVLESGAGNWCAENGMDLQERLQWLDELPLPSGPAANEAIESAVVELVATDTRVLSLGGDHAITYPVIRAHAAAHSGLTILQLDAHPDLYDEFEGNRLSHACPFARIMEAGLAQRLVQVGIRTMNAHQRAQAERFGVEVVEMRRWVDARSVVSTLRAPLYVSIDLDVLDPAFAPGVAHHEPGGASVREVVELIQGLPAAPVGADVVELNPSRDLHDQTAMVAAKLLKEIAARMLAD